MSAFWWPGCSSSLMCCSCTIWALLIFAVDKWEDCLDLIQIETVESELLVLFYSPYFFYLLLPLFTKQVNS